ncbi:hypothetical protein [Glaciibacter superstes]|uniref:hypothetical protein n=1 Tax=Glaciibacter superstes TaxID=501023 RepID=UPI0003B3D936|nr:hypothetical protein [Glaciibacter superstes]
MLTQRTKFASVIGSLAVAGLLLTGCAGGQSKADACTVLIEGLDTLQTELSENVSELQADPEAAAAAIGKTADKFSENVGRISNDDVKKTADKADGALGDLSDAFGDYAEDPENADTSALQDSATAVQDSFMDLQKTCSS